MAENPKKLPQINENLLDQLRGLFFAKDRSLLIGRNQVLGMGTQNTPTANPPSPYIFVYPKADGKFYKLDSAGNEQLIGIDTFLGLSDTPDSFTANYHLKVNSIGSELEFVTGQMELIREYKFLASDTDFTFADIPQNFRHLKIFASLRGDVATEIDNALIRFNGDTGNNYQRHIEYAAGATPTATPAINQSAGFFGGMEAANSTANAFAPTNMTIVNYTAATLKYTYSNSVVYGNKSLTTDLYTLNYSSRWESTNPITSITLLPITSTNFVTGCIFQLYGGL